MSIEFITLLLFASMFLLLLTGLPIAFSIGAVAAVFAIALWGVDHLGILGAAAFSSVTNVNLIAIPLFVFLGWTFKNSGIADEVFETVHLWLGHVPGGLAIGVMFISVLFGAICGDLAAVIFMMAAIALPAMIKRGYDKHLAIGTIVVGGLLGLVIPPSIEVIVYAVTVGESVGKLYLGTLVPGLLMAILYTFYIWFRCRLNPELGPPAPPEARRGWSVRIAALKSVTLPLLLVFVIMGGIYGGIMSPLEASAIAASGALIITAVRRRLTWQVLKQTGYNTATVAGLLVWIIMGVACFTSVYEGVGAPELAAKIAYAVPGGRWGTVAVMQIALLGFGMIMDDWAIILIFGPIFMYVIGGLGFDSLWYGVVFLCNMQVAFLTPPFGFALFYMRAAIPREYNITMVDIYRSVIPFIGLTVLALILVIIFQPLATFLPTLIIG